MLGTPPKLVAIQRDFANIALSCTPQFNFKAACLQRLQPCRNFRKNQ
jgi:hypothetical protein